jgi:hypothetical protein
MGTDFAIHAISSQMEPSLTQPLKKINMPRISLRDPSNIQYEVSCKLVSYLSLVWLGYVLSGNVRIRVRIRIILVLN